MGEPQVKKIIALGWLSVATFNLAYALPAHLTGTVNLKSYDCGDALCYVDMEIANMTGVSLYTLCGDKKYCSQYAKAYEKIVAKASEEDHPQYEINRQAKVTLKLIKDPSDGEKIYETTSITYLKE